MEKGENASDVFRINVHGARRPPRRLRLIDVSRYVSVSIKEKKQAEVIFRPLRFNSIT